MITRQKVLLGAVALYLLTTASAYAQLDVQLNLGGPAYIAPAPVYVSPYPSYYDPHHKRNWKYWEDQRRAREHSDNGRHEGEHERR